MAVKLQFENGDKTRLSQTYGPFDFAHTAGDELRVGPDGELFAVLTDRGWVIEGDQTPAEAWSEVVMFGVKNG